MIINIPIYTVAKEITNKCDVFSDSIRKLSIDTDLLYSHLSPLVNETKYRLINQFSVMVSLEGIYAALIDTNVAEDLLRKVTFYVGTIMGIDVYLCGYNNETAVIPNNLMRRN